MGTRSTTKIYDNGKLVLALYKQFDGYIEGWGKESKEFLNLGKWCNGICLADTEKGIRVFNGISDFALQIVTNFKTEAGGLYATTEDDKQEYNYEICFIPHRRMHFSLEGSRIKIICKQDSKFNQTFKIDKNGRLV